jgi:processive 1,2-diacylglycerol beta-glucosyltransferase
MMAIKHDDKILLLTGHYGAGHLQAAGAIQAAIQKQYPSVETVIIDPEAECRKLFGMVAHKLFIGSIKRFPSIYDYFYQKTRYPNYLTSLLKGMNRIGIGHILDKIQSINPTIIVSTDPTSASMVSILKMEGLLDVPTVTVITDYAVHSYWVNPGTDRYIVGSESVRKGLWQLGVADHNITTTGIPIHPKFTQNFKLDFLRQKHGLKNNLPTILLTGGGYGLVGNKLSISGLLEAFSYPVQLIVVCGHNHHLYQRIQKEISQQLHHHVILKEYVENMEELMAVSDVMITKAGGLSISEALSMNIPMVLYQSLGGHEQENIQYLLSHGTALLADNKEELCANIAKLVEDVDFRQSMVENMQYIAKKRSSFEAAQVIKATLSTQTEYNPVPVYQYL